MLVHVIDDAEIQMAVFFRLCGNFGRMSLEVNSIARIIDDSGPVLLREHTFAHDPVTVCGSRLQSADRDLVKGAYRLSSHAAEVIVFGTV